MGSSEPSKPKPTAEEQAQADRAWSEWQHWRQQYMPMEEQQIQDITTLERETPAMIRKAAGNVTAEFSPAFGETRRQLFQGGIDPTSGRYASAVGGIGRGAARTSGDVVNDTILNERARKMSGMGGLLGLGRGLAGQSSMNLSRLASQTGAQNLAKRRADAYKKAATANMWGTVAGSALGALGGASNSGAFDNLFSATPGASPVSGGFGADLGGGFGLNLGG